jgi:signal transduction histidine kinase
MSDNARGYVLDRQVFTTSRLLNFCSQKELVLQTGHAVEQWPLVILKELIDNALDACEGAGIVPSSVAVEGGSITVTDNAGGIEPATVETMLDFSVRANKQVNASFRSEEAVS